MGESDGLYAPHLVLLSVEFPLDYRSALLALGLEHVQVLVVPIFYKESVWLVLHWLELPNLSLGVVAVVQENWRSLVLGVVLD